MSNQSRRKFITKAGLLLGSVGVAGSMKYELLNKLTKQVFPEALAETASKKRILEICLRSGVPLIGLGAPSSLAALSQMRYANSPFAGNQYVQASNGLFLTPHTATLFDSFKDNFACTQSIKVGSGHTAMFSHRRSSQGSPILQIANRNDTASLTSGVALARTGRNNSVSNDTQGGLSDITFANMDSFRNLFAKPGFYISDAEAEKVLEASQLLSRRQALMLESKVKSIVTHSRSVASAVNLVNTDFSKKLEVNDIRSDFRAAATVYHTESDSMATTLKAMSMNLINSGMVVMTTGDWHGSQQATDARVRDVNAALAQMIAGAVSYMKKTIDPASGGNQTLWDTTTIVISSEFTRGISRFGSDNSDGQTSGIALVGKNVRGGYYGNIDTTPTGRGMATGFDKDTGAKAATTLTVENVRETVNKLCDNPSTKENMVMKCMLKDV